MEFNLTHDEIRIILHALDEERFRMRRHIPNHTKDQDYKDIVDLQDKIIQHLENLPY